MTEQLIANGLLVPVMSLDGESLYCKQCQVVDGHRNGCPVKARLEQAEKR